jgi:hypothetical protein
MNNPSITFADLERMFAEIERRKPIYYGDASFITPGTIYEITSEHFDKFLVIHPDDLVILRLQYPEVKFVHLRDKPAARQQMEANDAT